MENSQHPSRQAFKVIRWIARILSALIIAEFLFLFIGEEVVGGGGSQPLSALAIVQLSLAGIELLGLGLAWKWELVGGSVTLVAFIVKAIVNPRTLMFPLLLVPFTAFLFLLCWWMSRARAIEQDTPSR